MAQYKCNDWLNIININSFLIWETSIFFSAYIKKSEVILVSLVWGEFCKNEKENENCTTDKSHKTRDVRIHLLKKTRIMTISIFDREYDSYCSDIQLNL